MKLGAKLHGSVSQYTDAEGWRILQQMNADLGGPAEEGLKTLEALEQSELMHRHLILRKFAERAAVAAGIVGMVLNRQGVHLLSEGSEKTTGGALNALLRRLHLG